MHTIFRDMHNRNVKHIYYASKRVNRIRLSYLLRVPHITSLNRNYAKINIKEIHYNIICDICEMQKKREKEREHACAIKLSVDDIAFHAPNIE